MRPGNPAGNACLPPSHRKARQPVTGARAAVSGDVLAAPHSVDLECACTLRGLVRGRKLPAAEAERALDLLARISLNRYGHLPLLARIWQLQNNSGHKTPPMSRWLSPLTLTWQPSTVSSRRSLASGAACATCVLPASRAD
jgi:hypothetical protein